MTSTSEHLILRETVQRPDLIACPHRFTGCEYQLTVPAIQVASDELGAVFGITGRTFSQMAAEQLGAQAAEKMRRHLAGHSPEDWLTLLAWHRGGPE